MLVPTRIDVGPRFIEAIADLSARPRQLHALQKQERAYGSALKVTVKTVKKRELSYSDGRSLAQQQGRVQRAYEVH